MKVTLGILLAILLSSCGKDYFEEGTAYFVNHSKEDIVLLRDYYYYQHYETFDTTLQIDYTCYNFMRLLPHDSQMIMNWYKKREICKSDTFSVFVISADTMRSNSWSNICNNYIVLCRYDLSGNDIKLLNSIIPYPPSPEMKDIHMYPPYEEIINR